MTDKTIVLTGLLACICLTSKAQDAKSAEPTGKAIIQMFANFNTGLFEQNDTRAFYLERSYLGYEYDLGDGLSVKGVIDIGKSSDVDDYQRLAYIKNALVSWKTGGLTLNGGLISTTQFYFQEKFWGYRYILKPFQDRYNFGYSADLGISLAYKFADRFSADAIIVNGEGYKKVQKSNGLNYGLGVTLTPFKGFHLRLYGAVNESGLDDKENVINMAAFVGYRADFFSIGAEYNNMLNALYNRDADQFGYSVYATVKLPENTEVFGRYDNLSSKDDWNIAKDESAVILGAQFKLGKYVKVAPNFRMAMPKVDGADNSYSAYVSCCFGL